MQKPKLRTHAMFLVAAAALSGHVIAHAAGLSLKNFPIPEPSNLSDFVQDRTAAIALGKALFWDMQVGSDGIQACASCHFNAGADSRAKNQISPGLLQVNQDASTNPDKTFVAGPNYTLKPSDFPFHQVADVNDRLSAVLADRNDVVSSQGVFSRLFVNTLPGVPVDITAYLADPDGFQVNGVNVRRVEPRNTPTVINAVFNFRNFWDGRAQNDFNGVSPFGSRDPNAFLFKNVGGNLSSTRVSLNNSSLASQAVGPPGNPFEMSARNRVFPKIGVKVLGARPLAYQLVSTKDSVLGPYSRGSVTGLNVNTYKSMVQAAFKPDWYGSSQYIRVNADGSTTILSQAQGIQSKRAGENTYTQAEYNFSLFFGLAVQMYEATLVSDDTPFDRFQDGDLTALTEQQQRGFGLFITDVARCGNCHGGNELTDASVTKVSVAHLRRRSPNVVDLGFNNIGVRPTLEDIGVGGLDPFGNPLSEARMAFLGTLPASVPTGITLNPVTDVLGVDGAFKIPSLRNVELTAPYFHNGGAATLSEVMDFYFRGGDFNTFKASLGPVSATNGILGFDANRQVAVGIRGLGTMVNPNFDNTGAGSRVLNEADKQDLLAFLLALTDERVRYRKAPFDHPQLFVPNGQMGNANNVVNVFGNALDSFKTIPATGRNGGTPLPKFLGIAQP